MKHRSYTWERKLSPYIDNTDYLKVWTFVWIKNLNKFYPYKPRILSLSVFVKHAHLIRITSGSEIPLFSTRAGLRWVVAYIDKEQELCWRLFVWVFKGVFNWVKYPFNWEILLGDTNPKRQPSSTSTKSKCLSSNKKAIFVRDDWQNTPLWLLSKQCAMPYQKIALMQRLTQCTRYPRFRNAWGRSGSIVASHNKRG